MDPIFTKLYPDEKLPDSVPEEPEMLREQEYDTGVHEAVLEERSIWEVITRWGVYLIAFLTPLWFLPLTISPVDSNKAFLISVFAIIGFIAWLGMAVYQGKLAIPRSVPIYALGIWLVAYFLASLFSVSPEVSFWGASANSFFTMAIGVLIVLMTALTLRTSEEVQRAHSFLFLSAILAASFMIVQTVFGIDIFQWEFAKERTFNPIGTWNAVGIFFAFMVVSLMPLVSNENASRGMRIGMVALTIVSLILTAIVNFRVLWIGIGICAVVYLAYHYSRHADPAHRMRFIAWPMALLLLSVLLYLSQEMIGALSFSINPPLDVTPSVSSSLNVASEVLQENPLFGVGPNLFSYAWDRFKDSSVNTTVFWRLRFGTASSFATTLVTTTGMLGALTFLAFILSVIGAGVYYMRSIRWEVVQHRYLVASFLGLFFLLFSWFVYPITITIAILTFFALGLFIAHAREAQFIPTTSIVIRADSARGFVAALAIIFLMVFGVIGLYVSSQKYVAAIVYGRGVAAFNADGSVNEAEQYFRRAAEFDTSRDQYYRALAQMSSIKLQRSLANSANQAPEDVRDAFQLALSGAIASAQRATEVHPGDSVNWRLLGQIYESVIPFVGGAAEAALAAYEQAITRSPDDPVLRDDIARIYISLGDQVKARESLEEAIRLKSDYATAHFRLAQIAALKGNVNEATANTERAALASPNDIGILFQLGLLYYQQQRYPEASQILERAVSINQNYSNARYFLGLSYAANAKRDLAIEQFEHVRELNTDNAEIAAILSNLRSGKDALYGITPPPLDRGEVPVNKEGGELQEQKTLEERASSSDQKNIE